TPRVAHGYPSNSSRQSNPELYQKITSGHHEPMNPQLEQDNDQEQGAWDLRITIDQVQELILDVHNATEATCDIQEVVDFNEYEYESEDDCAPAMAAAIGMLSWVSARFLDSDFSDP
ncbi:hypothetical protein FRC11_008294, partial [Ceratobasidium sp. 423]